VSIERISQWQSGYVCGRHLRKFVEQRRTGSGRYINFVTTAAQTIGEIRQVPFAAAQRLRGAYLQNLQNRIRFIRLVGDLVAANVPKNSVAGQSKQ
jgi:UV DNA damage repair endonuclease